MSPVTRSTDELLRELEQEKSLDRLTTAMTGSASLSGLLQKVLEIFVEVAGADVGALRLREHDTLRTHASVGLKGEGEAGFTVPLPVGAQADEAAPHRVALDAKEVSEPMRAAPVRGVWRVPLIGSEQVGEVVLGTHDERALRELKHLSRLAARAAVLISRGVERESMLRAVHSRDEVLSVVAHDLQNPLNVISIAANTLQQRLPDSSARRPIERIIRAAQRADRLIRDLLEINAIETGRFSIERQRVEPADLILSALESQQSLAAEASVIIASDLSPELPPIEGDEERLLEVLENLVGNAVKFTGPGGSITVGAARQGDTIRLSVKDNGSGIKTEELPHIFDRFWQAKKAERRGTGLGLTICKGIVEAHGGRIWAESRLGEGTTVSFTLPALAPKAGEVEQVEVANILLVDDRPENLIALKAILERPDYRLVTATSGEEALGHALREQFSVALVDVAMPGMNGLEIAVHLKELERSRGIPIIFVTAFGNDPDEIHRAYSAGGADYLVKPLDTEIVRKKVAVFVDLSRRRLGAHSSEPLTPARH